MCWLCPTAPPHPQPSDQLGASSAQQGAHTPPQLDTQQHIFDCLTHSDLRVGPNLESSDADLVTYFKQVIERRIKNEQKDSSNT